MKHFSLFALSALTSFIFAGAALAQDEYAPLVQKETISVTRVNLDKLSSSALGDSLVKIASSGVDYFVKDADSAEETKQMLPLVSMIVGQVADQYVAPFTEAGVSNVYFIVDQPENADETFYPYLAIPTSKATDAQKKDIRAALSAVNQSIPEEARAQMSLKYRFERNGFLFVLFIPESVDADDVKTYIKKRFTKMESVENKAFTDGFAAIDENVVAAGVALNAQNDDITNSQLEKAFEQLEAIEDSTVKDMLKESIVKYNELGKKMVAHVDYNYWYLSLDEPAFVSNIKAKSADDAKAYVDELENTLTPEILQTIDDAITAALKQVELKEDDLALVDEGKGLVKEVVAALLAMSANDDVVTWKMDKEFWTVNKPLVEKIASFVEEKIAPKFNNEIEELEDDFSEEVEEAAE